MQSTDLSTRLQLLRKSFFRELIQQVRPWQHGAQSPAKVAEVWEAAGRMAAEALGVAPEVPAGDEPPHDRVVPENDTGVAGAAHGQ